MLVYNSQYLIVKVPITPSQTFFFLKSRPQIQAKASNKIEFEVIPDFYDAIENTVFEVKKEH